MSSAESPSNNRATTNDDREAAGREYLKLIIEQLEEERKTKSSVEQRAITVITTAGTLVSVLFALVVLVTRSNSFELESVSRSFLYAALSAFVVAALLALGTNLPMNYQEADVDELERLTEERFWHGSTHLGTRRSARLRVKVLRGARRANRTKACILRLAITVEVLAVVFLSVAVASILSSSP